MALSMDFSKLDARDVLDVAIHSEVETRDRYEEFATTLARGGHADAAKFFHGMAKVEIHHADILRERRAQVCGDVPVRLRDNAFWGIEAPDWEREIAALTVRDALTTALEAEIRAYDFYAGALEWVSEPRVTDLLEELRAAELEHQRFIRLELDKIAS